VGGTAQTWFEGTLHDGLSPGENRIYINQGSNCTDPRPSIFNPFNKTGAPPSEERKVGELGTLKTSREGVTRVRLTSSLALLEGDHSIIDKTITIHKEVPTIVRTSPNYPEKYGNDIDKDYTITVDEGSKISLTFTDFNIENHKTCRYDWVRVEDGDGSELLGKTCGYTAPGTIHSKTNKIIITFHSDYSVQLQGFRAEINSENIIGCCLIKEEDLPADQTTATCFDQRQEKLLSPKKTFKILDGNPTKSYCYDNDGVPYIKGSKASSCFNCFTYECSVGTDTREGDYLYWNLHQVADSCCQNCDGKVFPPDEVISTETLDNDCETEVSSVCKYNPGRAGSKAVITKTYSPTSCCTDNNEVFPLGSSQLEASSCSVKLCKKGNYWSTHPVIPGKCDCCIYNGKLVPDGVEVEAGGTNLTCCKGEMVRPTYGNWGAWSAAGPCPVTCGPGKAERVRECNNPAPAKGGLECLLINGTRAIKETKLEDCRNETLPQCSVDGNWGPWSWTRECSEPCGGGTRGRERKCDDPEPSNGGSECTLLTSGVGLEEYGNVTCNENVTCLSCHPPNVAGGEFSQCNGSLQDHGASCEANCSAGFTPSGNMTATCRHKQWIFNGTCVPVDGGWSSWYNKTNCPCGSGPNRTRTSERACDNPAPGPVGKKCLLGNGTRALLESVDINCTYVPCPVDGNWGEWNWTSNCSTPCQDGIRYKRRKCDNPAPSNGGLKCMTNNGRRDEESDSEPCNVNITCLPCTEPTIVGGNIDCPPRGSVWPDDNVKCDVRCTGVYQAHNYGGTVKAECVHQQWHFEGLCVKKLTPLDASMSSQREPRQDTYAAEKCYDNNINSFCHTQPGNGTFPWLAVRVSRAIIANVLIMNGPVDTRNLEVWVSDSLPTTAATRFTSGEKLDNKPGPVASTFTINENAGTGILGIEGSYVIFQTGSSLGLSFAEVVIRGKGLAA